MGNTVLKICKKHGLTTFTIYKNQCRCNKCMVEYDYKKRHKIKQELVDYKGGKCEICGYDKCINALEFHHLNPEEKEFALNTANYNKSIEKLKKEVDKCILVCANCHRELHYQENEERREYIICKNDKINNIIDTLDINLIKKDLENNIFQSEIAKKYNVSISTLKRFIKKNNLQKHRINLTKDEILKYYSETPTYTSLSKKTGCTVKVLKKYCIDNNLIDDMNNIRKKLGFKEIKKTKLYK